MRKWKSQTSASNAAGGEESDKNSIEEKQNKKKKKTLIEQVRLESATMVTEPLQLQKLVSFCNRKPKV